MALDWGKLEQIGETGGKEFLDIIKPYLPALARQGPEVFEGFVKHMMDKDWAAVDALMYERMTIEERRDLEDQAISGARAAAQAKFDRIQLAKDIGFKIALRILMTVALG